MQKLVADIGADINSEYLSLAAGASAGLAPGDPNYRGGHFNLNLTADQIGMFSGNDQAAFAEDFANGNANGSVRQSASTGQAKVGGYALHSQDGKIAAGEYSFHFDRFNPNDGLGPLAGHGIYDYAGGHLGHPCLDPAWH